MKDILSKVKLMLYYSFSSFCNLLKYNRLWGGVKIVSPDKITPKYITFGNGVFVWKHARIQGVIQYNDKKFTPSIIIGSGVSIQQNIHLTCASSIIIGENTAIAAFVTITDINHTYEDINIPIERQDIEVSPVCIGKDCKIYNNSVILPGCNIGDHVTIGANSVVTKDIPSYTVAAGAPAKVIKRYNFDAKQWESPID